VVGLCAAGYPLAKRVHLQHMVGGKGVPSQQPQQGPTTPQVQTYMNDAKRAKPCAALPDWPHPDSTNSSSPLLAMLLLLLLLLQIRTYTIDGAPSTGVHAIDLTLAELKKLRVRERLYRRSQAYNDFLPVMTFEECATMARVRSGNCPGARKRPTAVFSLLAAQCGSDTGHWLQQQSACRCMCTHPACHNMYTSLAQRARKAAHAAGHQPCEMHVSLLITAVDSLVCAVCALYCCCCRCCCQDFYAREGIVVGIYPETKHPTCECVVWRGREGEKGGCCRRLQSVTGPL
jgi:hypothetical protein